MALCTWQVQHGKTVRAQRNWGSLTVSAYNVPETVVSFFHTLHKTIPIRQIIFPHFTDVEIEAQSG